MEQRLVNYNTHTHTLSLMSRLRLESIWQAVKSVSEGVKHIKGGVRLGVRASGCACMLPLGPLACKNKRSYSRFKAFFFLSVFFFGFFVSPCNHQTRDGQLYEQTMRCDDVVCRMWRGVGLRTRVARAQWLFRPGARAHPGPGPGQTKMQMCSSF